jgi:hypothetical protein
LNGAHENTYQSEMALAYRLTESIEGFGGVQRSSRKESFEASSIKNTNVASASPRDSELAGLSGSSGLFCLVDLVHLVSLSNQINKTNQINQINEPDETDRTDQTNQMDQSDQA